MGNVLSASSRPPPSATWFTHAAAPARTGRDAGLGQSARSGATPEGDVAVLSEPLTRLERNLRAGRAEVTTRHLLRENTTQSSGWVYTGLGPICPADVQAIEYPTRTSDVPAACLRDDGRIAAVVGITGIKYQYIWYDVCVFDFDDEAVHTLLPQLQRGITTIAPLPGRRLALGHDDGSVAVADAEGKVLYLPTGDTAEPPRPWSGKVLDLCAVAPSLLAVLHARPHEPIEILDTDGIRSPVRVSVAGLSGEKLHLQPAGLAGPERGIPVARRFESEGWWAQPNASGTPSLVEMTAKEAPGRSWSGVALGCDTRAWISAGEIILRRGDGAAPQPDDVKVELGFKFPNIVAAMAVAPGQLVLVSGNGAICRLDFR